MAIAMKRNQKAPLKLVFDGIDVSQQPLFNVTEMAKVFFGRSSHWVRLHERNGMFVLDGKAVGRQRTSKGLRYYTLADIEKIAHALASNGKISGEKLLYVIRHLVTQALIYNYPVSNDEIKWVYQPILPKDAPMDYTAILPERGKYRWHRYGPEGDLLEKSRSLYPTRQKAEMAAGRLFHDLPRN